MSDLLEQAAPGWRPDPSGRYEWRYWDGGWTNRVANSAPAPGPDSSSPTTSSPAPATPAVPSAPVATSSPAPAAPVATAPVGDPFAALRTPRSAPEPAVIPEVAAPAVPESAVPEPLVPEPAPPTTATAAFAPVWTFPTSHDGSSGTAFDGPYSPDGPETSTRARREKATGILGSVTSFFRSFWEQEESYHSPNAGVQLPPHPKEASLKPLPNYGRAGLVMLAACGVAIGAYLPWITYRVGGVTQELSGYRLGHATGFLLAAAAFAIAAVLGARRRVMGWVTMGMSVVVAGLVAHRLLDIHDQVMSFNSHPAVEADIGIGLWVMLVAAAIGLIAAFRLDTPTEII